MKNIFKILMVMVLLASYACTTVDTAEGGLVLPEDKTIIDLSLENCRTSLGEKDEESNTYPVYWSEGDQVSINGYVSAPLAGVEANCKNASFEFTGDLGGYPLKVSYPATTETGTVLFTKEQNYVANTFESGVAAMYGEASNSEISLRLLTTIVQIPVAIAEGDEPVSLKCVYITDNTTNKPLAGPFKVSSENGEYTLEPTATAAYTITYNCEGLELSTTPTNLHIAVPAGIYERLQVTLLTTDNKTMQINIFAPESNPFKAGQIRTLKMNDGAVIFQNNGTEYQITDSESLMQFYVMCVQGTFTYSKALLMNDVTLEGYEWTSIPTFEGIFDGQGYKISGLTAPMFDIVRGTIRNLKLDANVSEGLSANVGRGLLVNRFIGTMDNVEVSGSITATSSNTDWAAVGGVIGKVYGSSTITNVVNKAAVSGLGTKRLYLGGILGSTRYDNGSNLEVVINNCHNEGTITSTEGGSNRRAMGGIMGGAFTSTRIEVYSCSNSGAINCNSKTSDLHIGGITGTSSAPLYIKDFVNNGPITISEDADRTGDCAVGGTIGYQTSSVNAENLVNGEGGVITFGASRGSNQLYVGGCIGRINGGTDNTLTNVENYALVTVRESGKNIYQGGVIGQVNTAATTMTNLVNHADLVFDGIANNNAYMGAGIVASCRGDIISATNYGNLTFTGKSVAAYYAGGIIAYNNSTSGSLKHAVNKGNHIFAGECGANLYFGGIAGNTQVTTSPLDGNEYAMENSGTLTMESAATTGAIAYIGGCTGTATSGGKTGLSNTGDITVLGTIGTELYVGGNVANATSTNSKLVNSGNINVGGTCGAAFAVAGCVTYSTQNVNNLTNSGDVTVETVSTYELAERAYMVGGAVGHIEATESAKRTINNITNRGNVTYNATSTVSKANIRIGGGVASGTYTDVNDIENTGKVVFGENANAKATCEVSIAGGMGWIYYGTLKNSVNGDAKDTTFEKGMVSLESPNKVFTYYAGGCDGYVRTYGHNNADGSFNHNTHNNYGKVRTTANFQCVALYTAGVTGWLYYSPSDQLHNYAPLEISGASADDIVVGGVAGRHSASSTGKLNYVNFSNAGNIDIDIAVIAAGDRLVGGVVGYNARTNSHFTNMTNTGHITLTQSALTGTSTSGSIGIGGIIGYIGSSVATPITKATSKGNITVGGAPKCSKKGVGGIVGYVNTGGGANYPSPITESVVNCNIDSAITAAMGIGIAANAIATVASTQFAGSIIKPSASKVTLSASNFYNYIYTTVPTDWTAEGYAGDYDGNIYKK